MGINSQLRLFEPKDTYPPFYPFSIRTNTMGNLDADDKAYNDFRAHFIEVTFENGIAISHKMGAHQTKAGAVIKPLIKLVTISDALTPVILEEARLKGIALHPGQGITLEDPERMEQVANPKCFRSEEIVHIDTLLVEYGRNLATILPVIDIPT